MIEMNFKKLIKKMLIKIFDIPIKKLGYQRKRGLNIYNNNILIENLINLLQIANFYPKIILDIGANHGSWSRIWKHKFPDVKLFLVEPQFWLESSSTDIIDSESKFLPIGAGKENKVLPFTINSDRDDSSTFALKKNEADSRGFNQIEVLVMPINEIINQYIFQIPDIIKIDAEGLDIEVLEGATQTFGKTEIYFVEVSINSSFGNNNLINVINFMDSKGYQAFDITDINRPFQSGILWLLELVFVKKDSFLTKIDWTV